MTTDSNKERFILSPQSEFPPPQNGLWLTWSLSALVLISLAALSLYLFWLPLSNWATNCYNFLSCKENIRNWLISFGPAAPVVFIVIQSLQVIFAPIPGEATGFLGGFLFGGPMGFVYSTLGLTLGSILAFLLGRWLEIHLIEKLVSKPTLDKFDFIIERQGTLIAFLLFLLPGFPKDYLCFILGLSKMPFRVFLLIVTIGRMPGTLMLSLQGAQVYRGDYITFLALLGLFLLAALLMLLYKESLYQFLRRWSRRNATYDNR